MSILNKIKAQINPFDGGATFNNPNPQQAQGIRQMVEGPVNNLRVTTSNNQHIGPAPVYRTAPLPGTMYPNGMEYNHPEDLLPPDIQQGLGTRTMRPQSNYPAQRVPALHISNIPMQPQGMPEDAGLVPGPQGYAPLNSDAGHLQQPQMSQLEQALQYLRRL